MSEAVPFATTIIAIAPSEPNRIVGRRARENRARQAELRERPDRAPRRSRRACPHRWSSYERLPTIDRARRDAGHPHDERHQEQHETKRTAMKPANSQVQTLLKLSFGQRVGQTGEIAEVESFTAKLRREIARLEARAIRARSKSSASARLFASVLRRYAKAPRTTFQNVARSRGATAGCGAPNKSHDARTHFRRRKEGSAVRASTRPRRASHTARRRRDCRMPACRAPRRNDRRRLFEP